MSSTFLRIELAKLVIDGRSGDDPECAHRSKRRLRCDGRAAVVAGVSRSTRPLVVLPGVPCARGGHCSEAEFGFSSRWNETPLCASVCSGSLFCRRDRRGGFDSLGLCPDRRHRRVNPAVRHDGDPGGLSGRRGLRRVGDGWPRGTGGLCHQPERERPGVALGGARRDRQALRALSCERGHPGTGEHHAGRRDDRGPDLARGRGGSRRNLLRERVRREQLSQRHHAPHARAALTGRHPAPERSREGHRRSLLVRQPQRREHRGHPLAQRHGAVLHPRRASDGPFPLWGHAHQLFEGPLSARQPQHSPQRLERRSRAPAGDLM